MLQEPLAGRLHSVYPDGDAAIRQTDSDAALARYSAVQKRYFTDPFIKYLVPRGAQYQPPRPPLINIGTYVRSEGVDKLVSEFFELSKQDQKQCQIVNLGAGSDSRFWRIAAGPNGGQLAAYIEIDFPEITTKKAMAIRKSRELSALLGKPEDISLSNGGTALHSPVFQLLPADMRLPPSDTMNALLALPGVDGRPLLSPSLPTLLLFECVLVYMSPEASAALMQWFVDYFAAAEEGSVLGGVVYEMFGLNDPFGKVMLNNLKARNVALPGAEPYVDIKSLPQRFLQHGFSTARALTLRDIRQFCISPEELDRISQLEMLDEVEELDLVLEHYAITWGAKIFSNIEETSVDWTRWGLKNERQLEHTTIPVQQCICNRISSNVIR